MTAMSAVGAIEDFMDWCEGESKEEEFRFIRIGEDADDNIERGWLTHDVHITRGGQLLM